MERIFTRKPITMADNWIVTVDGQSYGPYPLDKMQAFITEGRVIPQSLVSQPASGSSCPASEDPVLGPLFGAADTPSSAECRIENPAVRAAAQNFGRHQAESPSERSNIVIISDIKSRSIHGLEEAIFNLGQAYPLLPQVWLLTSGLSVNTIRGQLAKHLGKLDMLFVVDATHGTAAWANFGPEPDSRIRRMWAKPDETERKAS